MRVNLAKAIVFLGSAGSGKGKQSKMLAGMHGFTHLGSSELFKKRLKTDLEFSAQVAEHMVTMEKGNLLPDKLVWSTLLQALVLIPDGIDIVFDGCTRTMAQMAELLNYLDRLKFETTIICLDVPEEKCRVRIGGREKGASPEEKRADDAKQESIEERLKGYKEHLPSIMGYVQGKGRIVHIVDGDQSADEVFLEICNFAGLPIPALDSM